MALAYGAHWHEQPFAGFGLQKRKASELATSDWILNLDADEVPTPAFWHGLSAFFSTSSNTTYGAATIQRDFVLFNQRLRFGGASDQRRIRLFDRRVYEWNLAPVHEDVVLKAEGPNRVGRIEGCVLHYSWASSAAWLATLDTRALESARVKIARSTSGASSASDAKGKSGHSFGTKVAIITRFFLEFVRGYLLRLGFLDGVPGFVFCFFMAFSHVLKFIKVYELGLPEVPPEPI